MKLRKYSWQTRKSNLRATGAYNSVYPDPILCISFLYHLLVSPIEINTWWQQQNQHVIRSYSKMRLRAQRRRSLGLRWRKDLMLLSWRRCAKLSFPLSMGTPWWAEETLYCVHRLLWSTKLVFPRSLNFLCRSSNSWCLHGISNWRSSFTFTGRFARNTMTMGSWNRKWS